MERGEVQRHFRSQVFQDPFGELAEFARVVVESRDDQVGDFKPNVGLLLQPLQHFQYGLQVSQRNAPVKVFRKRLQVHVGGVDVVVDFVEGVVGDVAVVTITVFSPYSLAAWQMSITYSPQMVGSL